MLDISGLSGHVLNVVTEQGGVQGNFAWRPQIRERVADALDRGRGRTFPARPASAISRWGFAGTVSAAAAGAEETEYRPATGCIVLARAGSAFRQRHSEAVRLVQSQERCRLDLEHQCQRRPQHFRRRVTTLYQVPGQPRPPSSTAAKTRKWRTEIGTDYEFALGAGRLKLVGFFTRARWPELQRADHAGGGRTVPTGSRFSRDSTEGERVLRSEYRWKGAGADWTVSAEAAYNFVDATGASRSARRRRGVPARAAARRQLARRGKARREHPEFQPSLRDGWSLQVSGGVRIQPAAARMVSAARRAVSGGPRVRCRWPGIRLRSGR